MNKYDPPLKTIGPPRMTHDMSHIFKNETYQMSHFAYSNDIYLSKMRGILF